MMPQQPESDVMELEQVLDREYACLLQGDIKGLPEVMKQKENILDRLERLSPSYAPVVSVALSEKAARNQQLLTSAASGLRSVLRRLTELRSINDGSGTYQANGVRHTKKAPTGGLSRRA